MSNYRSPYVPRDSAFVDEYNSGVQLVMPDMSKSVQEIIELSMSGQDPMIEYVPDRPYGQDLTDMMPNVDELGVLDETINVQLNNNNKDVKDYSSVSDVSDTDNPSVPEKTEK